MNVQSYEHEFMKYNDYVAHKILLLYVPPVLLVLGTFGNLVSFCILMRSVRKASTYSYLSALSIFDLLVLYIGLLRLWVGQLTNDIRDEADWLCKLIMFLGYVSSDTSVWLIVAVTIERFIVVYLPLQATRMCTVRIGRVVIVTIVLVFVVINSHFFWSVELTVQTFNESVVSKCQSTLYHERLVNEVWPWVDAAIYSFLPLGVIAVGNTLIIRQIILARKTRNVLQQKCLPKRNGILSRPPQPQAEMNRKITLMLLAVSFTFLFTTLPMNITLIVTTFMDPPGDDAALAEITLVGTIAQLLMYTNHSINFFLYCATGRKFRSQFHDLACYICSGKLMKRFIRFRRMNSQRSATSLRLYKRNSTSGNRTIFIDYDNVPIRGTIL